MAGIKRYVLPKSGITISQEGSFDLSLLQTKLKNQLAYRKYRVTQKKHETKNRPLGQEITADIRAERDVDEEVRFNIDITLWGSNLQKSRSSITDSESGRIDLSFTAFMELDYKEQWKSYMRKFLQYIHYKFVINEKIEDYEDILEGEATELIDLAKEVLGLYS